MYAIVKTGGKQYKVAPGDRINIEKLDAEVGAEVVEQFKGPKQLVFKFKKRKNYKKLRGHRQQLTRVEIKSIA